MKVVQVHNFYQQPGGEDIVVSAEKKLLEQNGHIVIPYYQYNSKINDLSGLGKLKLFGQLHFNKQSYHQSVEFLEEHKPDLCHVHNTLHLISPAIYKACKATKTPIVQTLHNYRFICSNGMLTRNDKPCEDCLGQSAYNAIKHKCYRNSYLQTLAVARMIEQNKKQPSILDDIDAFICFTDFARKKFVTHGIPEHKIHLKSNFTDICSDQEKSRKENFLIYVGRLEQTKGVQLLGEMAKKSPLPIHIIGDGPLRKGLEKQDNIVLKGKLSHSETIKHIQNAKALLFPSMVYEGMPMTIIEAFANHTPVIASNFGAMATMIEHEKNGLLFELGNHSDFLKKVMDVVNNEVLSDKLAENGFKKYKENYTPQSNYESLKNIYQSILKT